MRILVTGSSGFVGSALVDRMIGNAVHAVRISLRRPEDKPKKGCEQVLVGDLDACTDWEKALLGIDVVVHLAARVHMLNESANEPLAEFRRVNVEGTLNLARQAAVLGVKRFVFLSSIKVNGEGGVPKKNRFGTDREPYSESHIPAPVDAYGVSKYEAELGLNEIAREKKGMAVVIIRPPLVYGPGVRANFLSLMRAVEKGRLLPLGAIHNRRSLVALDNLVAFILTCVEHPAAANETFLVSDGEDLSTAELVRRLAHALGRPDRLFPIPAPLLNAIATLLGKRDIAQRLLGSLQVDISKARKVLGWVPPLSVDEGLARATEGFRETL